MIEARTRQQGQRPGQSLVRRVLKGLAWAAGALAALTLLLVLGVALLDTPPGHAVEARLVDRLPLAGGVRLHVGGIEGSIWGRMALEDVSLTDAKGVFLTSPRLTLDWNPWALLHRRVDVREASAETVRVLRRPDLGPSAPRSGRGGLPNIVLSRLHVSGLWLQPGVAGQARRLGVDGELTLIRGRAQADLAIAAEPVAGRESGDRMTLRLDAQPARDRLILDAHLVAPKGGVVDRLTGLNRALTADVSGRGSWAAWSGSARAVVGGQPLLNAELEARNGRFSIRGSARPALVANGPAAALSEPRLGFGVVFSVTGRRVEGAVALQSAQLAVLAQGGLDLGRHRFVAVALHGRIADPHALASNLSGRSLRMDATLHGAFDRPSATYRLQAAALRIGHLGVDDLDASGQAAPDSANGWIAEFQARVSQASGAGAVAEVLSRRLQVLGTVRLTRTHAAAKNLQIRSDHVRASVDLDLAFDTGAYRGKVEAQAMRVPIQGLGLVDASADVSVATAGRGRIRASGRLHGRTVRLDNGAAAKLLGGPAVADATLQLAPDGAVTLANLTLSAPKFRIANGRASYGPGHRIAVTAVAVSADYGALDLKVSGSIEAPRATLHADDLKVAGLKDLDVELNGGSGGAYAVKAQGSTRYGPLSADVDVTARGDALSAKVRSAEWAGVRLTGALARSAAGSLTGTLDVSGRGLAGTVRFTPDGARQAVVLALSARDTSLPLQPPVTIASGTARARVTFGGPAPSVTGTVRLQGVRRGDVLVSRVALQMSYAAGRGSASLELAGKRQIPFALALSARILPGLIRIDGSGTVDRIPVRIETPAEVRQTAAGYQLAPTVLTSGPSRVEVSGRYGAGLSVKLDIARLDLGLSRVAAPGLGISGRASGTADLALPPGGAIPTAHVRLQLDNVTRSTVSEVSEPVDLVFAADLDAMRAQVNALVRQAGTVVGRAQASLALSPRDRRPWPERFRSAPLTGGVRFNGDARILWSLTGMTNQALSGPIAIGADVTGSLQTPRFVGIVQAKTLRIEDTDYGAVIDNIAIDARLVDTRLQIDSLSGRAGGGSISASGYLDLSIADGLPMNLQVRFTNARLANADDLGATLSGRLSLVNGAAGALASGDLTLDQGNYQFAGKGKDEIVELAGVHRAGQAQAAGAPTQPQATTAGFLSKWRLNVRVHAAQQLYVRGMGLDSEWRTDLTVAGTAEHPMVIGDVTLVRGTFAFAGRDLTLSRGTIHLDGASPPNPTLDIEATATVEGVTAVIDITGASRNPQITFSSSPELPQDEVLSRLLFGSSVGQLSALQAVQLAASLNALRGGGGGFDPIGKLRQATGLDTLRFYGADQTTGRGAAIGVGRHIAKNLYVELTTDAQGYTATQIELALTKSLSLLSKVGTFGGTAVELRYSHRY